MYSKTLNFIMTKSGDQFHFINEFQIALTDCIALPDPESNDMIGLYPWPIIHFMTKAQYNNPNGYLPVYLKSVAWARN